MKIIVNIATVGDRKESLNKVLECLNNQTLPADQINVYDNLAEDVDLTDNGKFYFLQNYSEPIYYLSCDDDILYPPNYIEKIVNGIEEHKSIVTFHGRLLRAKGVNYYRGHKVFRCLGRVTKDRVIDVAGTGVTGFRTDYFNPLHIWSSKYKQMSDLVFSLEAAKQGKNITVLKHNPGLLSDISQGQESSCYQNHINTKQTDQKYLADQILAYKGR